MSPVLYLMCVMDSNLSIAVCYTRCMNYQTTLTNLTKNRRVWSVMLSVNTTHMAILQCMTQLCVWRSRSQCAICSSMVKVILAQWMMTLPQRCVIPKCACKNLPTKCWVIWIKTLWIGSQTMMARSKCQASCQPVFQICWSMVPQGLQWVWRPIWRHII